MKLDKFEQLKKHYISSFEQKKVDLDGAWQEKDIGRLESLLHKLAGSSGSYEFNHLSQLCRQSMECINESFEIVDKEQFESYLKALFAELDKYIEL